MEILHDRILPLLNIPNLDMESAKDSVKFNYAYIEKRANVWNRSKNEENALNEASCFSYLHREIAI